jgi:hypothetical protein
MNPPQIQTCTQNPVKSEKQLKNHRNIPFLEPLTFKAKQFYRKTKLKKQQKSY